MLGPIRWNVPFMRSLFKSKKHPNGVVLENVLWWFWGGASSIEQGNDGEGHGAGHTWTLHKDLYFDRIRVPNVVENFEEGPGPQKRGMCSA